jgi:hypothetical protein
MYFFGLAVDNEGQILNGFSNLQEKFAPTEKVRALGLAGLAPRCEVGA